jgi:hypothetical protein
VVKVEELSIFILEIELVKQLESKLITLESFNLLLKKSLDMASMKIGALLSLESKVGY